MYMRLGTWNVRSLYRTGSIRAAASDLVGVQEIRSDKEGTVKSRGYNFFYAKGIEKPPIWNRIFVHRRINSTV
jgi:hypothetical protein